MNSSLMFSKASDLWSTPLDFWRELDREFEFVLDAAATQDTSLVGFPYYGPDHPYGDGEMGGPDALAGDWHAVIGTGAAYCNPPYSQCAEFVAKAAAEAKKGCTVVMLIPSRTDTRYWHEHIWDREKHQPRPGVEVRFLKGRLKFGNSQNSAPFPSVIVVFRPPK